MIACTLIPHVQAKMEYCILQIVHRGKFFQIRQSQNFSSEIVFAIGFGCTRLTSNCKSFPVNYILYAAKVFPLKSFVMYGTLVIKEYLSRKDEFCNSYRTKPMYYGDLCIKVKLKCPLFL